MSTEPVTLVCFHAHPDDEALLTGGTIAQAAEAGHRVVLVVATAGERGLAAPDTRSLGRRRMAELMRSAALLGIARIELLGYADSGLREQGEVWTDGPVRFADADIEEAATRLAAVLREEAADLLTVYDARGGYGHPDHVQVHRVGIRAAVLAGTPRVLEATVDNTWFARGVRVLRLLGHVLPVPELPDERGAFTPRRDLTHRIDVTAQLAVKRAALAAHRSQQGGGPRTVALLVRLPAPLARVVLGHEWFREVGSPPGAAIRGDLLDPAGRAEPRTAQTG